MPSVNLKFSPRARHVYRDGAVIGSIEVEKKSGMHQYREYRFDDPLVLIEKSLAEVLRKVRQHEEGKG